ncbi:hypothetical protein [Pseudomonas aestiva]|uniref:hypothetical protein n=1 Tax=Pseudomonas aestiva TaxID=3136739 RepID=UPI0032657C43
MRVSVDQHDPGYSPGLIGRGVKVFLDGVEQRQVVTADDELGLIVMYDLDEQGNVKVEGDEVVWVTVHGAVKIELPYA